MFAQQSGCGRASEPFLPEETASFSRGDPTPIPAASSLRRLASRGGLFLLVSDVGQALPEPNVRGASRKRRASSVAGLLLLWADEGQLLLHLHLSANGVRHQAVAFTSRSAPIISRPCRVPCRVD